MGNRIKAFGYAFQGILAFFTSETHAKVHLVLAILTIGAGILLDISSIEWIVVILCIGAVLMAEAMNSCIEWICNKVQPEYDLQIKKIKDVAAAAVLMLSICVAIIGGIIFVPKLFLLF